MAEEDRVARMRLAFYEKAVGRFGFGVLLLGTASWYLANTVREGFMTPELLGVLAAAHGIGVALLFIAGRLYLWARTAPVARMEADIPGRRLLHDLLLCTGAGMLFIGLAALWLTPQNPRQAGFEHTEVIEDGAAEVERTP